MLQTTLIFLALTVVVEVSGHGRLMEPPARNAMWRYGYPNPVNYNDNELYCGGFVVHYQKNHGQCGVCGDNFKIKPPRQHEAGGVFGNGIIVRRYVMGQEIKIIAHLTTNHKGWMEVQVCPNNNPKQIATHSCFKKYPLILVDGPDHRFIIPDNTSKVETFTWTVKLPKHLTCTQCVLRWTYFAGNTWGSCVDGSEGTGCGDQETFINCADVEIHNIASSFPPHLVDNPWLLYYRGNAYPAFEQLETQTSSSTLRPLVVRAQLCLPIGKYAKVDGMKDWCRRNCLKYPPNCHPKACKCVHSCKAIGEFALQNEADIFCNQNCLGYPSYCPEERCKCF